MKPALTHIALHVRDLERSLAFYRDYCDLKLIHQRLAEGSEGSGGVVWLAEEGSEDRFIFVLISGGPTRRVEGADFSHLGFAVESRSAVDEVAERASQAGCLEWPPREEPYPVGYYCGIQDPDGNFVEFSYGQPLGPGAEPLDEARVRPAQYG